MTKTRATTFASILVLLAALAPALSYAQSFSYSVSPDPSGPLGSGNTATFTTDDPAVAVYAIYYSITGSSSPVYENSGTISSGSDTEDIDSIFGTNYATGTADVFFSQSGHDYCSGQDESSCAANANGAYYNWVITPTPPVPPPSGCTNPEATNYDSSAVVDDGSCVFAPLQPTLIVDPDQVLAYAVYMYLLAFVLVVWLMRKH